MFIRDKSKKALSIMIGYVLLVVFAIVLGTLVYGWMKTYVPKEDINCPSGSAIFVDDINYDCDTDILVFELKNNGQFDLGGYYIYASDISGGKLENIDISPYYSSGTSVILNPGIEFDGVKGNSLSYEESVIETYNLTSLGRTIYSIRVVPLRWQEDENELDALISCRDVVMRQEFQCASEPCVYDGQACTGKVCGTFMDNCYTYRECGSCSGDDVCNSTGQCVTKALCATCNDLGWECGSNCGTDNCGTCTLPETCVNGICVDTGGGGGIPNSCPAVCSNLGYYGGPQPGSCQQNTAQCNNYCNLNGILESSGDAWCDDPPQIYCCCCLPQA